MKILKYTKLNLILILISVSFLFKGSTPPDEGMFPLSEIRNLDLQSAGLRIPIDELYNPDGVSIVDALVRVGGCSGSFVSDEGLILTNHHCVFDAVQKASTIEQNYLENGFLADSREKEIPAQGIICSITESYEDVTDEVLEAVSKVTDISERTKVIADKMKEIAKREEENNPGISADVSEMFTGQSYVLFRYKTIKDVRLVYVPPRSIGEFGGETDNWIWPRHTGDFSFLRAYVAPDGSGAEYSQDNVPYKPKRFLKVNPNGVEEEDFVFILGYPGRTFRHQPYQYIQYQENYLLPFISSLNSDLINYFEAVGMENPELGLQLSSRIKRLANVMKNYRGKIIGLERLNLTQKKKNEDLMLAKFISESNERKEKYGNVIDEIANVYDQSLSIGSANLGLSQLFSQSVWLRAAEFIINEFEKDEDKKEPEKLKVRINTLYADYNYEVEENVFKILIEHVSKISQLKEMGLWNNVPVNNLNSFFTDVKSSIFVNSDFTEKYSISSKEEAEEVNDILLNFAMNAKEIQKSLQEKIKRWDGELTILLPKYLSAKMEWKKTNFVPDANRTLRLTYGYIRGYSPADAVKYYPITTLRGVIEKGKESGDFQLPDKIRELYNKKDFGRFVNKKLNDVPVAILYSTDTSGGNSGSPIMNAYGELIGVNFDRAFEATINDFAWSEDYSRSIGVDIRYILWVTQKVGGADFLLKELGVE